MLPFLERVQNTLKIILLLTLFVANNAKETGSFNGNLSSSATSLSSTTPFETKASNAHLISEAIENEAALLSLLMQIVNEEFSDCFLAIVYDKFFPYSFVVDTFISLPNTKQIINIISPKSLENLIWKSPVCSGYFFFLADEREVVTFANIKDNPWNRYARLIIVANDIRQINSFASSLKGKNTEHIVGIIPGNKGKRWLVYGKEFFVSPPMVRQAASEGGLKHLFNDKLTDFRGTDLKLVTFEWVPNVFYYRNDRGEVEDYYGLDINVVKILSEALNFKIMYLEPPQNEFWGDKLDDGNWTGLIGRISRNEADMAVGDLFISSTPSEVVEFSAPIDLEQSCFMSSVPPPLPSWQSPLRPFTHESWLSVFVILLVACFFLTLLAYFNKRMGEYRLEPGEGWLVILGANFRVSVHFPENKSIIRVFFGFFLLYCIILTTAYSSNLTAGLTVPQFSKGLETFKDIRESNLIVGALGGFFKSALTSSRDEDLKSLGERCVAYENIDEIFYLMIKGTLVHIQNKLFLEYASVSKLFVGQRDPQKTLKILKECFSPYGIGIFLQKDSPLKKRFDEMIGRMWNGGLIRKGFFDSLERSKMDKLQQESKYFSQVNSNDLSGSNQEEDRGKGSVTLSVTHLQGIFFILLFGHLFACIIFAIEICCHKNVTSSNSRPLLSVTTS